MPLLLCLCHHPLEQSPSPGCRLASAASVVATPGGLRRSVGARDIPTPAAGWQGPRARTRSAVDETTGECTCKDSTPRHCPGSLTHRRHLAGPRPRGVWDSNQPAHRCHPHAGQADQPPANTPRSAAMRTTATHSQGLAADGLTHCGTPHAGQEAAGDRGGRAGDGGA